MADQPVIKNVSNLGELDVPLLRRFVDIGEEIEVSVEHAAQFLAQAINWAPVNDAAKKILADITPEPVIEAPVEPAPHQVIVPDESAPAAPVPVPVVVPVTPVPAVVPVPDSDEGATA